MLSSRPAAAQKLWAVQALWTRLMKDAPVADTGYSNCILARSTLDHATVEDFGNTRLATPCQVPRSFNHARHYYHGAGAPGSAKTHGTTVLSVRKGGTVVVMADGQVTMGNEIVKPNVRKVRRLGENGSVIGGYAGATADAFTLFERLETKLDEYPGQLTRAAVELAKAWRTDKFLRRLDAVMVVADADTSLTITGNGDVLEPYDGIIGIGSGGSYARAAARALVDLPDMDAETVARKAMKIAADCCIYTNHNFTLEKIEPEKDAVQSEV